MGWWVQICTVVIYGWSLDSCAVTRVSHQTGSRVIFLVKRRLSFSIFWKICLNKEMFKKSYAFPSIGPNILNTIQNVKCSCFCSNPNQFGSIEGQSIRILATYYIHYYLRKLETIIFLTCENLTLQTFVKILSKDHSYFVV